MNAASVGKPLDRVDGRAKVTGAARYAADTPVTGMAHAVIVGSTVAKGRIDRIAAQEAERAPGVIAVMTHVNAPRLPADATKKTTPGDRVLQILQDDLVRYGGQPVAVVVADTFERASAAAALVGVHYQAEAPVTEMENEIDRAFSHPLSNGKPPDSRRGDLDHGLAAATTRIEVTYTTPVEHHNPMEMHATVAVWQGPEQLTLYDATQGVFEVQRKAALALGLPTENVRIRSPFVGGGFGGKGSVWSHVVLAAMAARQVGRPVKLVLTRMQMFDFVGFRPRTIQKITLGATAGRGPHGHRARGHVADLALRRLRRTSGRGDENALRLPQRGHPPPPGAPRRWDAAVHARAGRVVGDLRPRVGHGRARRGARDRSHRAAVEELR